MKDLIRKAIVIIILLAMPVIVINTINILFINLVKAGDCEEQELYCAIPGGVRKANGVDVKRDCWQYKYKLNCERESKNDCSKININECNLVEEKCVKEDEEGGLKYCSNKKKSYACEREVSWEEEKVELVKEDGAVEGKELLCNYLCLDGNCDAVKKAEIEKDEDMAKSIGMLNALKEAKKGIIDKSWLNMFTGKAEHCDKKLAGYTNCCSKLGGWGKALGAGCSEDAKNLAKKRKEKKCVEIGTFCKTKVLGACIIKRTTFCCYESIISKLINQEAKKQLGRSNGDAENPSCEGLVLDEEKGINDLEKVDLSNIDFKEFYDEIVMPNIKIPNVETEAKTNRESGEGIAKRVANLPNERKGFSNKINDMESE